MEAPKTVGLAADPAFQALLEQLVDKKVQEKLGGLEAQLERINAQLTTLKDNAQEEKVSIVVFSGEMDNLMAAFIIATGAVAMGMDVGMYFTFWGLNALRKTTTYKGKSIPEQMIAAMLPGGPGRVATSRLNMLGVGPAFFKRVMAHNNVETLPDLIAVAQELGVRLIACEMSMGVMGIRREELLDNINYGGVATYLEDAGRSKITLFI